MEFGALIAADGVAAPRLSPYPRRNLAKAISWRVVGTADTFILSLVLLTFLGPLLGIEAPAVHHARTAGLIAATEIVTKIALYFFHEWLWGRVRWGVIAGPDGRIRELGRRSGVKTFTWRLFASLDTTILALVFTGSLKMAVSIGGAEVATKLILYYLHERIWARIRFGLPAGA